MALESLAVPLGPREVAEPAGAARPFLYAMYALSVQSDFELPMEQVARVRPSDQPVAATVAGEQGEFAVASGNQAIDRHHHGSTASQTFL